MQGPASGKAAARWLRQGAADGAAWRSAHPSGSEDELRDYVQRMWSKKVLGSKAAAGMAKRLQLHRHGMAYAAGAGQGSGIALRFDPLPLRGTASAVVYAAGGLEALKPVLFQLERLPLQEIVVVLGEATPLALEELNARPRVVIAHSDDGYASPHAARAAGAKLTAADTVLFADGVKPCPSQLLGAMLIEADAGADAVLCDRTALEGLFDRRGEASWLREFLNVSLGRPELRADAIGSVPFALSRRALSAIGQRLDNPARAHATALLAGLRVTVCRGVRYSGERDSATDAANAHAEAWRDCLPRPGDRLKFTDFKRNRQALGVGIHG